MDCNKIGGENMKIGRKLYYDLITGEVLVDTGEREGNAIKTRTVDQDIAIYTALSEHNRESFDYIELEYGQYAQDFAEANGYRVNPETKTLEFSYPDPNESEPIEPVDIAPLSEQVEELKARQDATENALLDMLMNF